MFEKLVITESESSQPNRKWYFLFSSAVLSTTLVTALLVSLFSVEISLGTDNFDMVQLVAPVEQPVAEPPPPEPNNESQPRVATKQATASVPQTRERPKRRVNMARVNESPRSVPKNVSTRPNTYQSRPVGDFDLGKLDIGAGGSYSPRRTGNGVSGSGSGATSSVGQGGSDSAEAKTPPPPPPPPRKAPPKRQVAKKRITSLGVINGKATRLPKPRYSAAARAVRAKGKVRVRVLIDENGRVVSANAVAGHPLLRSAAEVAAREARFLPTLLSGEPVKTSGVIVYNFLG